MTQSGHAAPRRLLRRYKLLGLVFLLLASNLVRCRQGDAPRPSEDQAVVMLPTVDEGREQAETIGMVYEVLGPPLSSTHTGPVVLIIHGSPYRPDDTRHLAEALAVERPVVLPELPGFGGSSRKLPDYSFVAHAVYLEHFVRQQGWTSLHVVAHSQGGGVALEFYRRMPYAVTSLSMVSSIGAQEFELLGIHGLNRALHGIQLALLNAAGLFVPHFGLLDRCMFNTAYARNFYDSDMRPLRNILTRFDAPVLLIHGRNDLFVPLGAAQESYRLMPQSELAVMSGGHVLTLRQVDEVAGTIHSFLGRVEAGLAPDRARADPERVAKANQPFNKADVDKAAGVAMIVMILLIALATLVSEDLACIGAGLLAAQGVISYLTAVTGAFIGIFVGDLLLFWVGHHWGRAALRKAPFKWMITEAGLRESSKWFARKGPVVVLLSRFVPGSRFPTFVTAGMLHTRFWMFFLFFLAAGLIWAPLLVWLAMTIGQQIIETLFTYKLYTLAAIAAAALLLWLLFRIVIPSFSFKGRRLLWSRWRRLTRWEFWPTWLIYPPVVVFGLYLGIRYRGFTLFTAANPAIPLGGFLGESKKAILDGIGRRDLIARYALIPAAHPPEEKEAMALEFIDRHGLPLPVVLKPDVGQRGAGVLIARNVSAIADYFAVPRPDTLVQEYIPGFEFGLFYYRMPGQPRGHILSITEKRFPTVVGDGRHDLQRLILMDPRAVCMAPFFFRSLDECRYIVPAEEEMVPLAEIGTHRRGALLLDGRWIKTLEMERAIDELSQSYPGFYFGRYDIRASSLDNMRAGRGFKVIELNGVSSESTNIYDPGNGLFDAYNILFRQWRIAFKIGERNRRKGIAPASLRSLLESIAHYESPPEA